MLSRKDSQAVAAAASAKKNTVAMFHHLVSTNNLEQTRNLLIGKSKMPPIDPNIADEDGYTALHWAARSGHDKMTSLLIEYKASVDSADKDLWQPLHWAALLKHLGVVQVLMQAKANVKAREKLIGSKTPIDLCPDAKMKRIMGGGDVGLVSGMKSEHGGKSGGGDGGSDVHIFRSSRDEVESTRGEMAIAAAKRLEHLIEVEDSATGKYSGPSSRTASSRKEPEPQRQSQIPAQNSRRRYESAGGVFE